MRFTSDFGCFANYLLLAVSLVTLTELLLMNGKIDVTSTIEHAIPLDMYMHEMHWSSIVVKISMYGLSSWLLSNIR